MNFRYLVWFVLTELLVVIVFLRYTDWSYVINIFVTIIVINCRYCENFYLIMINIVYENVIRIDLILLYVIIHWWLEKSYILIIFIIFDNRILDDLNLSSIRYHIIYDMYQYLHTIFYQLFSWYSQLYFELLGIRNYYTIRLTII